MGYYQCFLCNYESSYRKNVVLSPTLYLTCVFTYRDMLGHCCWGNDKFKGFWTCVCVCVCVCFHVTPGYVLDTLRWVSDCAVRIF